MQSKRKECGVVEPPIVDESLPVEFRVALMVLGGIGGRMIWQWWGHPVPGVSLVSSIIGAFLLSLSSWAFVLHWRG